jgi:acyl-coenzyme A thioesterase PaaI-like protein
MRPVRTGTPNITANASPNNRGSSAAVRPNLMEKKISQTNTQRAEHAAHILKTLRLEILRI